MGTGGDGAHSGNTVASVSGRQVPGTGYTILGNGGAHGQLGGDTAYGDSDVQVNGSANGQFTGKSGALGNGEARREAVISSTGGNRDIDGGGHSHEGSDQHELEHFGYLLVPAFKIKLNLHPLLANIYRCAVNQYSNFDHFR